MDEHYKSLAVLSPRRQARLPKRPRLTSAQLTEIERLVREMMHDEVDDRRIAFQVAYAQRVGRPCMLMATCGGDRGFFLPGPPTHEVHIREQAHAVRVSDPNRIIAAFKLAMVRRP